jgi:hypothetical protein
MSKAWFRFIPFIIFLSFCSFYLYFQTKGIFGGDSGDLVAAAYTWGIPHPPGYPLYTLIAALLIKLIPFNTPAWRVSLLSSATQAATLAFLYLILKKFIKNQLIILVSVLTLGFSYIFWLYAEVPEVFGLHNLFTSILVYLILDWYEKPTNNKFYLFIFVFGLSLSHHHTVLLLTPAFGYLFSKKINRLTTLGFLSYLKAGFFFLLGLLPYLYLPLAGLRNPPIDWAHPVTLANFFALLTRSIYGTFISFSATSQEALLRLFQIPNYFFFIILNISLLGLMLVLLGAVRIWQKNRNLSKFLFLAFFFTGPFFVFYASFPLVNQFLLGTFERFILLSLSIIMIFFAIGAEEFIKILTKRLRLPARFRFLPILLIFIIPLFLLKINFKKMWELRQDFYADRLARDILNTAEPNAILILSSDNILFNSQYAHYALGERKDVIIIHQFLLQFDWYQKYLGKTYPALFVPQESDRKLFLQTFLAKNSDHFPIFSNEQVVEDVWLEPVGLLYKYHASEKSLPSNEEVVFKNNKIWSQYQNLSFLLANPDYHSFPLSIIDTYREGRLNLCQRYLEGGLYQLAVEQCQLAQKLKDKDKSYLYSGTALTKLGHCQEAEVNFQKAILIGTTLKDEIYNLLYLNASFCWKNQDKINYYKNLLDKAKQQNNQK